MAAAAVATTAAEKSTKERLLSVLDDLEVLSRELIEMLALSRGQKLPQPGEDAQILELLVQRDREFQELMEVAQQQGKVHQEMQLLEKEVEKRDSDIQQLQKQLKEAEHILVGGAGGPGLIVLATAVYQAKEKLKSIEKARKGEQTHTHTHTHLCLVAVDSALVSKVSPLTPVINCLCAGSISSEEIIKYAHRISASNAVCAPLNWVPGDPRRPYPTDLEMRSGMLGHMANLPTNGVNGHLPGDALAAGRLPDILTPHYPWQSSDVSVGCCLLTMATTSAWSLQATTRRTRTTWRPCRRTPPAAAAIQTEEQGWCVSVCVCVRVCVGAHSFEAVCGGSTLSLCQMRPLSPKP
ncbi:hypothetical protein INR49_018871 [Caranx melampygus]|nr:hypothetical protein INR49_018871 [Caranx melampygus]